MQKHIPEKSDCQLYDVPSAARYLAISERKVRDLIKTGELSVVRIGRRISVTQAELESFVQAHTA